MLKNDTKRREQRERFSKRYFKQRERERHENRRRGFVRLVAESFGASGSMKKISIDRYDFCEFLTNFLFSFWFELSPLLLENGLIERATITH